MSDAREERYKIILARALSEVQRRAYVEMGLGKGQFAEQAGINRTSWSGVENGKQDFSFKMLAEICAALDWDVADVLAGIPSPPPRAHGTVDREGRVSVDPSERWRVLRVTADLPGLRFRAGECLVVDRGERPRAGDAVVVEHRLSADGEPELVVCRVSVLADKHIPHTILQCEAGPPVVLDGSFTTLIGVVVRKFEERP